MKIINTNIVRGLAVVAAVASFAPAQAATGTGSATVEILEAITVTEDTGLNFGLISPSASIGTVDVTELSARSCSGGVTCVGTGTAAAGAFTITGTTDANVQVTLPADVTLTGPGTDMTATLSSAAESGTLALTGGAATFNVAGSLAVGANQAAGTYNGTYTVTVNYQ